MTYWSTGPLAREPLLIAMGGMSSQVRVALDVGLEVSTLDELL